MGVSTSAIRAGQAFVEILADDSKARAVLKGFQARMESWATTLNQVGRAMLLPALGVGLALKATTKVYADFEQEMAKVKARLDATDTGFENLKRTAIELGKTTAFSATQVAEAMTNFAEAGYDSTQIATIMRPTLNLAAAGMMELGEAADIVITTLNSFGLKADQIPHVVDIIAKASIESASDVRELAQAFVYASAVASTAGVPLGDLVGILSMLHDAGIKADMAGTSIRGILLSLTSPSKEAAETMKALGVEILDAQGNMIGFDQIIAQFQKGLKNVGSGQRLGIIGKIFDTRQAAAFAKLLDFGPDKIRDRIDTVYNSQGAAAAVAKIQLDTLAGEFRKLRGAMEAFAITVTGAVVEPLRAVIDTVRNVVLLVDAWAKKNPALVKTVAALAVSILLAAPALIAMSVALKLVAFAFQPIFLAMTLTRSGILLTVRAFTMIGRVMMAAVVPLLKAGYAMLIRITTGLISAIRAGVVGMIRGIGAAIMYLAANPIMLLGVALAGIAAYALYMSGVWTTSVEGMSKLWKNFASDTKTTWGTVVDVLAGGAPELAFQAITLFFQMQWSSAVDYVTSIWETFIDFFTDVFANASTTIAQVLIEAFTEVKAVWIGLVALFGVGWDLFKEHSVNAVKSTQNWLAEMMVGWIAQMQGIDPEEARQTLLEDQRRAQRSHDNDPEVEARRQRLAAAEKDFTEKSKQNREEGNRSFNQAEKDRELNQNQREKDREDTRQRRKAERDAQLKQLDELRQQAREARHKAEANPDGTKVPDGKGNPRISTDLSGVKTTVIGTFSAAAARGLGAGDRNNYLARIANASEGSKRDLDDIKRNGGNNFT